MSLTQFFRCRVLARFLRNRKANIAPIFALTIIPVIGFVGAAIDYSRANSVKAAMQAAIDSTALMLSKDAASLSSSQLNQKANDYFQALFHRPDAQGIVITPTYTNSGGSALTVTAYGSVKTEFMAIVGISQLDIGSKSTVMWGQSRLRVSLVLDVTGSMASSGKITALKTAAKNLLNQLKAAASTNGDVYVSIVPFAKDVNVGPSNYNQDWIKWSGASDTWDENVGICSNHSYNSSKANCVNHSGTWAPNNHNTWNGCVTDRDQNYDTTNAAPSTSVAGTLFPAEQYNYCPESIMELSYDWTALTAKIDALQPGGGTNQAIGLQWGFQSLTASPFSIPTLSSNYQYQQVIILLSDGLNTQDRWYGNGSTPSSQVDARQQILCANVKAAGITLYTVQVNTDGDPTSTLLQNCASDSSKFFLLTSSSQIVTTFNQIGTALSQLRIAK